MLEQLQVPLNNKMIVILGARKILVATTWVPIGARVPVLSQHNHPHGNGCISDRMELSKNFICH